MKYCNSEQKYKRHQQRVMLRQRRRIRKKSKKHIDNTNCINRVKKSLYHNPKIIKSNEFLKAPSILSMEKNTNISAKFFSDIRKSILNEKRHSIDLFLDLSNVIEVDFSAVMIFKALARVSQRVRKMVKGNLPLNEKSRQYLIDSNFFEGLYNQDNRPFKLYDSSIDVIVEKGQNKLTDIQNKGIRDLLNKCYSHLSNESKINTRVLAAIREICGNSIEWSDSPYKLYWTIGAKFENDKIIFVAVDLGVGIIKTLNKKLAEYVSDFIHNNDNLYILKSAFEGKYKSRSGEINRNQGLSSIKSLYDDKIIKDLLVITNNVILYFDDKDKSSTFAKDKSSF